MKNKTLERCKKIASPHLRTIILVSILSIILLSLTGCQSEETISSEVKTYSVYIAKETEDGIYEAYDEVEK